METRPALRLPGVPLLGAGAVSGAGDRESIDRPACFNRLNSWLADFMGKARCAGGAFVQGWTDWNFRGSAHGVAAAVKANYTCCRADSWPSSRRNASATSLRNCASCSRDCFTGTNAVHSMSVS